MRLIWHTLALDDFERIVRYCRHNFGKQTAEKVRDKYRKDISLLKNQPDLGFIDFSLTDTGILEYRSLIIEYTKVVYTIHADYIFIHLIWDCRRRPDTLSSEVNKREE